MKTLNFYNGQKAITKTDAVCQKTQQSLNKKEGTVILVSGNEVYVEIVLRGKHVTLPFAKTELIEV